jgi:hypothetical protein
LLRLVVVSRCGGNEVCGRSCGPREFLTRGGKLLRPIPPAYNTQPQPADMTRFTRVLGRAEGLALAMGITFYVVRSRVAISRRCSCRPRAAILSESPAREEPMLKRLLGGAAATVLMTGRGFAQTYPPPTTPPEIPPPSMRVPAPGTSTTTVAPSLYGSWQAATTRHGLD